MGIRWVRQARFGKKHKTYCHFDSQSSVLFQIFFFFLRIPTYSVQTEVIHAFGSENCMSGKFVALILVNISNH